MEAFFRQSEDYTCSKPLYEKNLEDNSQYIILYSAAWKLFGKNSFRETVIHTYNFINKELAAPSGGDYSNTTITDDVKDSVYYSCSIKELEISFSGQIPRDLSSPWIRHER